MKTYSFYDPKTGAFHARRFSCSDNLQMLANNTPEGHVAIEGVYEPQTHRVDVESGAVIALPAPPQADPSAALMRRDALSRIEYLESKQTRVVREIILGISDIERLKEIDAEIEALRALL